MAYRLLLNLFRVADVDPAAWVGYSRTEGKYSDRSVYPESVTYHRVVRVVQWLVDAGWAETEPGYYDWNLGYGWQSLVRATPALMDRLSGFAPVVTQAPLLDRELVRLKDSDKKPITDYKVTPQVLEWRDGLRRINAQIAGSKLGFGLSLDDRRAMVSDLRARHACPDLSRIQLYRSFNDGRWDRGGRFYGGWWINLPSEYRRYITIDGEATEEPDFSAYHLSMLYRLEGLSIPDGDLYDIGWNEQYRPMIKKFTNALLYADSVDDAYGAMMDFRETDVRELWNPFDSVEPALSRGRKGGVLVPMLDAIRLKHAGVAHCFGRGDSTRLQFEDSQIAEMILEWSVRINVTVLPVHDSFIVPAKDAALFEKHMQIVFDVLHDGTIRVN